VTFFGTKWFFQVPSLIAVVSRAQKACVFQTPEALPLPVLVGISDINQKTIESFFPNRPAEKSLFFLTSRISPPFREHYLAETGPGEPS